jgi:type I restriction enzyme S subunit
LQPGDLLVSTANSKALVGKSCLVDRPPFECTFGAFVTLLRPTPPVSPAFLAASLRSSRALAYFYTMSSNTTNISNLRVTDLLDFTIPLPPLNEQRCIATRLSEQIAQVERMRQAAQAQVEAARALPAAFVRQVFDSDEAKVWPAVPLAQVAEISYGITKDPSRTAGPNQVPYLRVANVQSGWFDLDDVLTLHVDPSEYEKAFLKPGDLLFIEGNSADLVGRCALWEGQLDPCAHQNHVLRARIGEDRQAIPKFIYFYGRSTQGQQYFRAAAKQTTGIATMNSRQLSRLPVPLPPIPQQQQVVSRIESNVAHATSLRTAAEAQLEAVNALSGVLLEQVFGGFEPPQ